MESNLRGNVVLVTGASGGIGNAISRAFAAEGAIVVAHFNRGRARAAALQRELGPKAISCQANLTRESDVKRLFTTAVRRFGRVDTLIANAGAWEERDIPLHKMSLTQWRRTFEGVLTTSFLCARQFLKIVARRKRGNIVFVASTAAVFGEAGHADYAAMKSAMAYGLTRSLKNEIARLAPHTKDYCGGRVNCICPGWTVVPRTEAKLSDRALVRRITATMALPKVARPEDIAKAVVFLSSDSLAAHITGQTVVIAGGMEGRVLWPG